MKQLQTIRNSIHLHYAACQTPKHDTQQHLNGPYLGTTTQPRPFYVPSPYEQGPADRAGEQRPTTYSEWQELLIVRGFLDHLINDEAMRRWLSTNQGGRSRKAELAILPGARPGEWRPPAYHGWVERLLLGGVEYENLHEEAMRRSMHETAIDDVQEQALQEHEIGAERLARERQLAQMVTDVAQIRAELATYP